MNGLDESDFLSANTLTDTDLRNLFKEYYLEADRDKYTKTQKTFTVEEFCKEFLEGLSLTEVQESLKETHPEKFI
jgi:hypothetical protein